MNPVIRLLCAFVLLAATELRADIPPLPAEPREAAPASSSADTRLPGVALAEGITQLTGVAISPLLGVSGVGAWEYFTTEASRRPELPWFCHPVAWGIGFGILALVLIKDLSGAALPAMLKKPLDVIELFENKLSAIVASAALVPFLDRQIAEVFVHRDEPVAAAGFAASGLAVIEPALAQSPTLLLALLVPLSLIAFFAVWLSSHALNVLILLSPFGFLDLFLKGARVLFVAFLALLSAVAPVFAAILCGILILAALWFAPRAFRVCLFGSVMSVDLIRSLVRKSERHENTRAFLARPMGSIAALSLGRLVASTEGGVVFSSRFLLVGPSRSVILPPAAELELEKGLLFPSLRRREDAATLLHFLPRHRHDLPHVAGKLGIARIADQALVRGVKAAFRWVSESARGEAHELPDPGN
jgi:hypothetical protein